MKTVFAQMSFSVSMVWFAVSYSHTFHVHFKHIRMLYFSFSNLSTCSSNFIDYHFPNFLIHFLPWGLNVAVVLRACPGPESPEVVKGSYLLERLADWKTGDPGGSRGQPGRLRGAAWEHPGGRGAGGGEGWSLGGIARNGRKEAGGWDRTPARSTLGRVGGFKNIFGPMRSQPKSDTFHELRFHEHPGSEIVALSLGGLPPPRTPTKGPSARSKNHKKNKKKKRLAQHDFLSNFDKWDFQR